MKIIFTLSLMLNVLLAGSYAGHMMQSHRMRPARNMMEMRPQHRGVVRGERDALIEIMRRPEFDAAAFQVQLDKYSDAQCDFNRKYMIDLNERLQKMPADDRAEILDRMTPKRHRRR